MDDRGFSLGVLDLIDGMNSLDVFHGDMHSANIMVDSDSKPVVSLLVRGVEQGAQSGLIGVNSLHKSLSSVTGGHSSSTIIGHRRELLQSRYCCTIYGSREYVPHSRQGSRGIKLY